MGAELNPHHMAYSHHKKSLDGNYRNGHGSKTAIMAFLYKDYKKVTADLKMMDRADDEQQALDASDFLSK